MVGNLEEKTIFDRYGKFMKRWEQIEHSRDSDSFKSYKERIESLRLKVIDYFMKKGIVSYSWENNYEICYNYDERLNLNLLTGLQGKLFFTKEEYAQQFKKFIVKYLYPNDEGSIRIGLAKPS